MQAAKRDEQVGSLSVPQLEMCPAWGVPQPGACWGPAATLTAVTQARAAPGSPRRLSVL